MRSVAIAGGRLIRLAGIVTGMLLGMSTASAGHFLYGHLFWKARPDIAPNTAEITVLASFRLSAFSDPPYSHTPNVGDVVVDRVEDPYVSGNLSFGDGYSLPEAVRGLRFVVTGIDAANDLFYARAIPNEKSPNAPILHTYQHGAGPYIVSWESCCRSASLRNSSSASFRVATTVNFNTDVSSAIAPVPPTITCFQGQGICTVVLSAADSDGDVLAWRVATAAESGATPPPNLTINQTAGQVRWDARALAPGLWTAQAVIQSAAVAGGPIKSNVALDFQINLLPGSPPGTAPQFVAAPGTTTALCSIAPDLVIGKEFRYPIRATDSDAGNSVTLTALILPQGATMTPILPRTANPVLSEVRWTPTVAGIFPIMFRATDSTGRTTDCQTILQVRGDRDGDGLPDGWETHGYRYNNVFVDLPAMGANPNHKDVFLEIDYLRGLRPDPLAVQKVVDAFGRVPNNLFRIPNPDGRDGITLHVTVGNEVPFQTTLGTTSLFTGYDWAPFEAIKQSHFSLARRLAWHYALFANIGPTTLGSPNSGVSRGTPGSDILITLGAWPASVLNGVPQGRGGTIEEQAGTLMHELGHGLGLTHGGPLLLAGPAGQSGVGYKPNYLSVMNYLFQLPGLRYNNNFGLFDYSRFALPTLSETGLSETVPLAPALLAYGTAWYCGQTRMIANSLNATFNWDCSGITPLPQVSTDINKGVLGQTLISYNDWANLIYTGGSVGAGLPLPEPLALEVDELTVQDVVSIPPPAPSGLTARIANGNAVRLAWNPLGSLNSHSYRVYRRRGGGAYVQLGLTQSPALFESGLPSGTYTYQVTGINTWGVESQRSNEFILTVP